MPPSKIDNWAELETAAVAERWKITLRFAHVPNSNVAAGRWIARLKPDRYWRNAWNELPPSLGIGVNDIAAFGDTMAEAQAKLVGAYNYHVKRQARRAARQPEGE